MWESLHLSGTGSLEKPTSSLDAMIYITCNDDEGGGDDYGDESFP